MSRVPAIRFKGFTDPWEQRKFSELIERRNDYSDDPILPRVEYEDIVPSQGTLNKDVINKRDKRSGIVFESGDVLYGKLRPYLQNWLNPQFRGIALGDFWVLNPIRIDSGFLFYLIRTSTFERIANESVGTKMPRADWQNVSNAEFVISSSKNEQRQIGTFFQKLDHLITLHQRKYDKLCTVKKSMLDKMFPKPGEFVPEIRFEGFTDPWEQRKLGEVASLLGGNAWSSKEYDPSGDYLVITIANVTGEYEVDDSEGNRINVNGNFEYLLSHGDILVSLTGNVGRVSRMTSTKAVLNQRVGKLSVDCDIDDEFIFQAIRDGRFLTTMETASQGAAQKNISNSDVLSFELLLPTLKEQQVVGEALHRIDTLITLHQRKLELLKNIKKSLLDKMFV